MDTSVDLVAPRGRSARRFRPVRVLVVAVCCVGLGLVVGSCHKKPEDLSHASAERIYLARCSRCHEVDGSSATASAKADHDIDFRDPEFQLTFDDAAIRKIATYGQGKMLGITGITATEIDSVIVHIRRIGAGWQPPPAPSGAP